MATHFWPLRHTWYSEWGLHSKPISSPNWMQNVLPNACGPLATLGLHDPDYQGHSKMLVNVLQLFGPYDWSVNFLQWDWLCVNANVLQKLPQTLSRLPPANSPINSRSNVWVIPFGNAAEDNPKPVNGRVSCFLKPKPSPGSSRDSAAAVNTSHPDDVPLCSFHVNGKKSPNFSTALNGNIPCLSDSNTWRKKPVFSFKSVDKKTVQRQNCWTLLLVPTTSQQFIRLQLQTSSNHKQTSQNSSSV